VLFKLGRNPFLSAVGYSLRITGNSGIVIKKVGKIKKNKKRRKNKNANNALFIENKKIKKKLKNVFTSMALEWIFLLIKHADCGVTDIGNCVYYRPIQS